MYLVDKRISSDPSDLHSVHPATYLFKYARPTRTEWEAWLQDDILSGLPRRGSKCCPGKRRFCGGHIPEVERNKRIRRPPVRRLVYLFYRHSAKQRPGRTNAPRIVSMRGDPGRESCRAGRPDGVHYPFGDSVPRSGGEGLFSNDKELIARALRFCSVPVKLQGPNGTPKLIFRDGRVCRQGLDKNLNWA